MGVALALARALGASVEDVFGSPPPSRAPVFPGVAREHLVTEPSLNARPATFVAGCDVSAGLLARHAELREREVRALWLPMTNRAALDALRTGLVHAAVLHGETRVNDDVYARFELASTEEGWIVARDNPLRLRGAKDLVRKGVRLVNRPSGAAARALLDAQLRRAHVDPRDVTGYGREVAGQLDAGRAIAQGFSDVAVGTASAARTYDLDFLPLRAERCTLVVHRTAARDPQIRAVLDALRSPAYRDDMRALDAYDVQRIGERIA